MNCISASSAFPQRSTFSAPSLAASCSPACRPLRTVLLPFASAYKDVFAFAVVIAIMAWPHGLIREKISERAGMMVQRPTISEPRRSRRGDRLPYSAFGGGAARS